MFSHFYCVVSFVLFIFYVSRFFLFFNLSVCLNIYICFSSFFLSHTKREGGPHASPCHRSYRGRKPGALRRATHIHTHTHATPPTPPPPHPSWPHLEPAPQVVSGRRAGGDIDGAELPLSLFFFGFVPFAVGRGGGGGLEAVPAN